MMQIVDMVKLIYQNEFGSGHMVTDVLTCAGTVSETDTLRRLMAETNALGKEAFGSVLFEDIGNGLSRLYLSALSDIELSTVNRFFVSTANTVSGGVTRFEGKLEVLKQCCNEDALPFDVREIDVFADKLRRDGYAPPSHSLVYKAAYAPAYRVVRSVYREYYTLFQAIDRHMKTQRAVCVAIDGNSGAGKTTLAALLARIYDSNVFHMDHFFLPPDMKTEERLATPGGNVDHERVMREVIGGIRTGRPFRYRAYDCHRQELCAPVKVKPKRLNIIEGCYSMHPALAASYDIRVFLQLESDEQRRRILDRDGADMLERYIREWIPLENTFFDQMQIRQRCDLVFG